MIGLKNLKSLCFVAVSVVALGACFPEKAPVSPGETTAAPFTGTGSASTATATGTASADCPAGFTNVGIVASNTLRACQLPSKITGTLVVPRRAGTVYAISGRVDVGEDLGGNSTTPVTGRLPGVLSIEPGVRLFGSAGLDYIVVNRGSRILADGTATLPIIFTSRQSIDGTTGIDSIGQWGGLVILGRAPTSNCSAPGATPGSATCEAQVEGTSAFFGGDSATDNSGILRYVRVMHSGFQILPNNELNGITLAGVGTGTVVDFVQVHNSSDDGIEWFGGTVNAKHLVLTGNDDDNLDTDVGFSGSNQFVIVIQRTGGGDRIIEASSAGTAPRSAPKISNFTFVSRAVAGGGDPLTFNSSTGYNLSNGIVVAAGTAVSCLDIDATSTSATFNSVRLACGTPFRDDTDVNAAAAAVFFNAGTNNSSAHVSTLTGTFINGANESAVPVFNATTVSTAFTATTYIGALRDNADTWYAGWTCGLPGGTSC